jgi:outer membrane lipoprotein-sorting protein
MKKPLIALAASAAVVAYAMQLSLPPALSGHATKLKEAQTFKAKVSLNEVGGATVEVELTYSRPNLMRIETPTKLVVGDGTTLSVLDKTKNTFTQAAYDRATAIVEASSPAVWGWVNFLETDVTKLYKTAKAGAARKLRGVDVVEVEVGLIDGKSTATLYIEPKSGVARGYQLNTEGKQYVVWTETTAVGTIAMPPTEFNFTAPAGATKLEPGAVGDVAWAEVATIFSRNCMPCHSAQLRSGALDLSTYQSVAGNRFVVKGDAKNSVLALALRASGGKRMPQGRPPLPESQIKQIEAWINGGLKQ